MKTAAFDFHLPQERIAQSPVEPRDSARLLHVAPAGLSDHWVSDLPNLLRPGDLLVMNDTRVIPARLFGKRGAVMVEALLHKKIAARTWTVFARPSKRLKLGDQVIFAPDFSAEVLLKHDSGEIDLHFNVPDEALLPLLTLYGAPPLPPYIKRSPDEARAEQSRYQTVYAKRDGAIAAPTAGLHFTPGLLAQLQAEGIETTTLTLHVGAGTFFPVKVEDVKDHVMHSEWGEITAATAAHLNAAKRAGRRIVAVGTTSLRLLESAADEGGIIHPFSDETAIFITPGYTFKAVDALLTNFHLPKSTLFMLVCAFAGMERMKAAYAHAIAKGYRFYSYGDACLLEPA